MSSTFINGAMYAVSKTLGAALAISAITNANPAEATTTAAPADGSIAIIKSGWTALNESVARTASATATTFDLEGVDTTDTTRYPAGEGAGSIQVVSDWTGLSQVRNVEVAGGEQQFFQYQYVEDQDSRQRQKPTFKNAMTTTITLDYDEGLAWYAELIKLDAARDPVVMRETLPNGAIIYYFGYISFNKVPTKTINENMTVTATFSLLSAPIRYAS